MTSSTALRRILEPLRRALARRGAEVRIDIHVDTSAYDRVIEDATWRLDKDADLGLATTRLAALQADIDRQREKHGLPRPVRRVRSGQPSMLSRLLTTVPLDAHRITTASLTPEAIGTESVDVAALDALYLRLKGARERLCVAQVLLAQAQRPASAGAAIAAAQSAELQGAINAIDRVGAFLPQWSRFDMPDVAAMEAPEFG